jgi:hypothetical protein
MMELTINEEELREALAKIELSKKNGFTHSVAIFGITEAGRNINETKAEYESVILKAHPTDLGLNWGRTQHPEWCCCINGKMRDIKDLEKMCERCKGKGEIEDSGYYLGSGYEGDLYGFKVEDPLIPCPACSGSGEKSE